MDKRKIENLLIALTVILLACAAYFAFTDHYMEEKVAVNDHMTILSPSTSKYTVKGDTIEFRNPMSRIYDLNVVETTSDNEKVRTVLNYFSMLRNNQMEYLNESYYKISGEFDTGDGFKYHVLIVPIKSFNKDTLSFSKESKVLLFEGKNRDFVLDSVYHSEVTL